MEIKILFSCANKKESSNIDLLSRFDDFIEREKYI